jgi:hypothetical protein
LKGPSAANKANAKLWKAWKAKGRLPLYANATKYLTKLDDPAEVAALDTKAGELRQAIDERVPNGCT